LSVVRPVGSGAENSFETFIKITADGSVTAFNGHVDLGTGIAPRSDRSSLKKNSTYPLRVSSWCWAIPLLFPIKVLPSQSETIQITAVPLRIAARRRGIS